MGSAKYSESADHSNAPYLDAAGRTGRELTEWNDGQNVTEQEMSFEYARRLPAKYLGVPSMGTNRSQSARQGDILPDGPNMDPIGGSSRNDRRPRQARRKASYRSWIKASYVVG
jgi:hypothetical protein